VLYLTVRLVGASVQLLKTKMHEERAVDEHAVGAAFDLEVGEQHIGAEEREDLVHDVVLALRRRWSGSASTRLDGQDGASAGLLRVQLVERRVIRRHDGSTISRREERVCDARAD
jgi:hypothetical protein